MAAGLNHPYPRRGDRACLGQPRPPSLRAGAPLRSTGPLRRGAQAGESRLVGRPRHTHPGRGNSGELEGPAAQGWPPSPNLCLLLTADTEKTLLNLAKPRGPKGGRPKP